MRILKDTVRPELARIKRELEALKGLSVHIGIMGDSENDLLMIARVHEYGATINAKNVKHLAIPLTDEAKGAKSPRQFDDLRFIPVSPGYGFLVRDKKPHKKPDKARQPAQHKAKTQRTGGKKDPRPNEDYEWMYMLVESVTIPERSFIRAGYDHNVDRLAAVARDQLHEIIFNGKAAQQAAEYIGGKAVDFIREYINTASNFKPKGNIQREAAPSWADSPLVVTGRLRNSITWKVEAK